MRDNDFRIQTRNCAVLRMERDGKMCVVGLRYFVARAFITLPYSPSARQILALRGKQSLPPPEKPKRVTTHEAQEVRRQDQSQAPPRSPTYQGLGVRFREGNNRGAGRASRTFYVCFSADHWPKHPDQVTS